MQNIEYLDGVRFCLVMMQVLDATSQDVKLTPVYGQAKVLDDRLVLVEDSGQEHVVPESALGSVLPSDGNDILKDSEYYVIVKVGGV
jgi:hypothetical protein